MTVDNLTDLNPPHVCACPYPGSVFTYVMVFFSVQCVKMKGDCWFFYTLVELLTITHSNILS